MHYHYRLSVTSHEKICNTLLFFQQMDGSIVCGRCFNKQISNGEYKMGIHNHLFAAKYINKTRNLTGFSSRTSELVWQLHAADVEELLSKLLVLGQRDVCVPFGSLHTAIDTPSVVSCWMDFPFSRFPRAPHHSLPFPLPSPAWMGLYYIDETVTRTAAG